MRSPLIFLTLLSLCIATQNALSTGAVIDDVASNAKNIGRAVFNEVERQVIEEYLARRAHHRENHPDRYADHDQQKPRKKHKGKKGNHKHANGNPKGLPPGIQMKLARGGTLPPGIAKKRLPGDLESHLPPVREGYQRYIADGKVILVQIATGIIVDLIREMGMNRKNATDLRSSNRVDEHRTAIDEIVNNPIARSPSDNQTAGRRSGHTEEKGWWRFWE